VWAECAQGMHGHCWDMQRQEKRVWNSPKRLQETTTVDVVMGTWVQPICWYVTAFDFDTGLFFVTAGKFRWSELLFSSNVVSFLFIWCWQVASLSHLHNSRLSHIGHSFTLELAKIVMLAFYQVYLSAAPFQKDFMCMISNKKKVIYKKWVCVCAECFLYEVLLFTFRPYAIREAFYVHRFH